MAFNKCFVRKQYKYRNNIMNQGKCTHLGQGCE